jgi:hypothetical protein
MFNKPGDTIEGSGVLLKQGRIVTQVDYHLAVPTQTHFLVNPGGSIEFDYEDHVGGFILVPLEDAETLALADYSLELADKTRLSIRITQVYARVKRDGISKKSFWVKVAVRPH